MTPSSHGRPPGCMTAAARRGATGGRGEPLGPNGPPDGALGEQTGGNQRSGRTIGSMARFLRKKPRAPKSPGPIQYLLAERCVGRFDRCNREVSSRLDATCTLVTLDSRTVTSRLLPCTPEAISVQTGSRAVIGARSSPVPGPARIMIAGMFDGGGHLAARGAALLSPTAWGAPGGHPGPERSDPAERVSVDSRHPEVARLHARARRQQRSQHAAGPAPHDPDAPVPRPHPPGSPQSPAAVTVRPTGRRGQN
jgi:hypothetical protein